MLQEQLEVRERVEDSGGVAEARAELEQAPDNLEVQLKLAEALGADNRFDEACELWPERDHESTGWCRAEGEGDYGRDPHRYGAQIEEGGRVPSQAGNRVLLIFIDESAGYQMTLREH